MAILYKLLPIFLLAISSNVMAEEAVVALTSENFDSYLQTNKHVLVEFYAPWCGVCQNLAPEYELAAQKLAEMKSEIKIAKLDASAETALGEKFAIKGYPTIFFFVNGVHKEYTGGRKSDDFVQWVLSRTAPSVVKMEKPLSEIIENEKIIFVINSDNTESEAFKMFQNIADSYRDYGSFYYNTASNDNTIIVHRFEEGEVKYQGFSEEDLLKFIKEESFPLFGPINELNFKNYMSRSLDLVWICGSEEHYSELKSFVREAAKSFTGQYSFIWLDTVKFQGHAENSLGVSEFPAMVYQAPTGRYVLPKPQENLKLPEAIVQFMKDAKDNKIEKSLRSEPIPETNNEPVKVVVAKTFEEIVLQKDKDVLLEVYAAWCGHCKKLEPIYNTLADKMKDNPNLVIAKMDGSLNESPVESFTWTGFPTIFWIKAGTTEPIKYSGERTVEAFTNFINSNLSIPFQSQNNERSEEL